MEGKAKLHYFKIFGRAEPIRFALTATGVDFEDIELNGQFTGGEEGAKEWNETKKNYEFESVPVLEIDGKALSQSRAILRYIMQRKGLYPTDAYEVYRLESLIELYNDIETALFKAFQGGEKGIEEFMMNTFFKRMAQVEKRLKENSSAEFLVGDKLSSADCLFCNLRFTFFGDKDPEKKKQIDEAFGKFEGLTKYFEARKGDFQKRLDSRPAYKFWAFSPNNQNFFNLLISIVLFFTNLLGKVKTLKNPNFQCKS